MVRVVAPAYDLADRAFQEIELLIAQHLMGQLVTMKGHERVLRILNLGCGISEIRAKTADNLVSLLGEGRDYVTVDEAARLKPMVRKTHLSQRPIDNKGWVLLGLRPRGKGSLYDRFKRRQDSVPDLES